WQRFRPTVPRQRSSFISAEKIPPRVARILRSPARRVKTLPKYGDPVGIVLSRPALTSLGTFSVPRFRSVLSHWIRHCELGRFIPKKGRPGISFPVGLSIFV